jgi:putative membrane protein
MPTSQENDQARTDLAAERTQLAGERTQLSWVRTGLAAIAVGVGLARVVPLLDSGAVGWPYEALGVAYCAFGVGLIYFGVQRGKLSAEHRADKRVVPGSGPFLAAGGILLGIATILVVAFAR